MKDRIELHREICTSLTELYRAKNADYGNSFTKLRNKYPDSILIRLNDKLSRLETLMQKDAQAQVPSESIDDTLRDLANYAIMELTERAYDAQQAKEIETLISQLDTLSGEMSRVTSSVSDFGSTADRDAPLFCVKSDGSVVYDDWCENDYSDLFVWHDGGDGLYYLEIEKLYEFYDERKLVRWLRDLNQKLWSYVRKKEPHGTYEINYGDCISADGYFTGSTLTEVATKFAWYVRSMEHFYGVTA